MNIGTYKVQGQLGIDVSKWQANIDWKKAKADGVKFAILREGYGRTLDSYFIRNVKGCKEAGVTVLGVYHFSYALTAEDAKNEAAFCIQQCDKQGLGKDVMIWYDFEYDTVTRAKSKGVILGPVQCTAFTKAFCSEVEKSGRSAGVYLNIDYYRNWYGNDVKKRYKLWLADYSGALDYPCMIRQFSSAGKVNGISGNVDMCDLLELKSTPIAQFLSIYDVACEVIDGKWGVSPQRKKNLEAAGYDYAKVQARVNRILAARENG